MHDDLIEKAVTHKYIKRTGTPGNYKYWYKMPDGSVRSSADDPDLHAKGKIEHLKRLILGKHAGHHSMSNAEMQSHVGVEKRQVTNMASNMRRAQRTGTDHGLEDHEIKEAHEATPPESSEAEPTTSEPSGASSEPTDAEADRTAARARRAESRATRRAAEEAAATTPTTPAADERSINDRMQAAGFDRVGVRGNQWEKTGYTVRSAGGRYKVTDPGGAAIGVVGSPEEAAAKIKADMKDTASTEAAASTGDAKQKLIDKLKNEHGIDLSGDSTAAESAAAVRAAAKPTEATGNAADDLQERARSSAERTGDAVRRMNAEPDQIDTTAEEDAEPAATPATTPAAEKRKISGEISSQTHGRQINIMKMGPFQRAVEAAVAGGMTAKDAVRQEIPNFYEPQAGAPGSPEADTAAASMSERLAESARAVREAQAPGSPAARELVTVDPDFGRSEEAVQRMVDQQAAGENPYIARAQEIFSRIKGDLKEDRRKKCEYMLKALSKLHTEGLSFTEGAVLDAYKEQVTADGGRVTARTALPHKEFESGTFISLNEAMKNPAIDPEVERMKRGFAAKQYARLQPFLSDEFKAANPDGRPPPYPRLVDLKTWSQHGSSQADNISTPDHRVQRAMPQEFYDSVATGPNGKAVMPPGWMPLHLMPAWNYIVKKTGGNPHAFRGGGQSGELNQEYGKVSGSTSKINLGNQAKTFDVERDDGTIGQQSEGTLLSSLRKYVQMRGGHDQLVDIPKGKLSELGLDHSKIFKAIGKGGDPDIHETMKSKIVDPVGLVHAMMGDKDDKKTPISTSKSFGLYVNPEENYIPGEKLTKGERIVIDLRKAKVDKIQSILRARSARA